MSNNNDKALLGTVTVYCSKTQCAFKKNTDQYNTCHNRRMLLHSIDYAGGRLYVSDCRFCDCDISCKITEEEN